jgi:hypothetical protein
VVETSLSTPVNVTETKILPPGELLKFEGVGGKDVYNITAPFEIDGKTYIAGRTEPRSNEFDSLTCFFEEGNNSWNLIHGAPTFPLQDPFVTKFGDETILGGVELFQRSQGLGYRTHFFRGYTLQKLKSCAVGPDMMKGIRISRLQDGRIFVLTRPQSPWVEGAGLGKIGFTTVSSLDDLNPENILKAKIIPGLLADNEWGGADEIGKILRNGNFDVLGHRAYIDTSPSNELLKHYAAMDFKINPITGAISSTSIIARRSDFPSTPSKRSPELDDVVYPGGLVRLPNGLAKLYAGLSDTSAGVKIILQ